jgi:hypothetical protein
LNRIAIIHNTINPIIQKVKILPLNIERDFNIFKFRNPWITGKITKRIAIDILGFMSIGK